MGILSTAPYIVSFDAASLARMGKLMNTAPIFAAYYQTAMNASVAHVMTKAKQNASERFVNPSGTLMRGITGRALSPWEGIVGVPRTIPYARRRERGFSGMTDALGRYYPNDPGAFYLRDALEDSRPFIGSTFRTATAFALRTIVI